MGYKAADSTPPKVFLSPKLPIMQTRSIAAKTVQNIPFPQNRRH